MTATWVEQEWRVNAACARTGHPEAWSIPRPWQAGEPVDPRREAGTAANRAAIRVCRRCPVRSACARWALAEHAAGRYSGGVILAGIPMRREPGGQPSERSIALLRAIAGDAA